MYKKMNMNINQKISSIERYLYGIEGMNILKNLSYDSLTEFQVDNILSFVSSYFQHRNEEDFVPCDMIHTTEDWEPEKTFRQTLLKEGDDLLYSFCHSGNSYVSLTKNYSFVW